MITTVIWKADEFPAVVSQFNNVEWTATVDDKLIIKTNHINLLPIRLVDGYESRTK